MGKRSRKRITDAGADSRAARDAARQARVAAGEEGRTRARRGGSRPPAPWGSFPLSELVVLLGLGLCVAGFVIGLTVERGRIAFVAGIALAALAGLETAIREHYAGYRSHTTLLAGATAVAVMLAGSFALSKLAPTLPIYVVFLLGALVFGVTFPAYRGAFQNRSGGVGFR